MGKKIKYLIRSVNANSDDYDEKNKKIKFDSDDDLPPQKTSKLRFSNFKKLDSWSAFC